MILRKAEGLVPCVFEEGVTEFDLKDLKEESAVVITGVVAREDRAPHGFEIRLRKIKILSQPAEILSNRHQQVQDEHFPGDQTGASAGFPAECERTGEI